jgi:putative Mg2+ transporter-C (MgtC) family protein
MLFPYFSDATDMWTIVFRLGLSFVLSAVIGFERERSNQPAGLRTHTLIGIGSTAFMLLSLNIPQFYKGELAADPTRIAAQIVTGIGFLGAGAILKIGINVKGLTTAANIWVVCGVGMCVGAGLYLPAFCLTGLTIITLVLLNLLEKALIKNRHYKKLRFEFRDQDFHLNEIMDILKAFHIEITNIDFSESIPKEKLVVTVGIQYTGEIDTTKLYEKLHRLQDLLKVEFSRREQ